jgi:hypothetical protein
MYSFYSLAVRQPNFGFIVFLLACDDMDFPSCRSEIKRKIAKELAGRGMVREEETIEKD